MLVFTFSFGRGMPDGLHEALYWLNERKFESLKYWHDPIIPEPNANLHRRLKGRWQIDAETGAD